MSYSQQIQLLERLAEKTQSGVLDWKKSADENALLVSFRKNAIRLRKTDSESTNPTYRVELLDGDGSVVEEFSDADLDQAEFGRIDAHYYEALRDMFELARRRAYGADKVLLEILKDLE
jgi:hypothetical protein